MKIFLVVVAIWAMAYRGQQITPVLVQEMPNMATCIAVGEAFLSMATEKPTTLGTDSWYGADFKCVESK